MIYLFQLYIRVTCSQILIYVNKIVVEKDEKKKEAIRAKVKEYMNRAEELKRLMKPKRPPVPANGFKRTVSEDPVEELSKSLHCDC